MNVPGTARLNRIIYDLASMPGDQQSITKNVWLALKDKSAGIYTLTISVDTDPKGKPHVDPNVIFKLECDDHQNRYTVSLKARDYFPPVVLSTEKIPTLTQSHKTQRRDALTQFKATMQEKLGMADAEADSELTAMFDELHGRLNLYWHALQVRRLGPGSPTPQ